MDNILGLDFASEYTIHELIFINSGSNYYVRLPVDYHAALIAGNNSGKTSSLSALKLFLLPEVSFKKQGDKFGFNSGGTNYEDLTSYAYYLPSPESYIICDASNPKGRFTWVLYRTTNLGYERIAVPHGYEDFEHLFWNESSTRNENAGELQPEISITDIKKKLVSDFGGKLFTDTKSIGHALYTRTSSADDDSRFCLLPMAKGYSTGVTETMRSLLNMAFGLGNASTTSLPQAIGSILDGAGMSAVKKSNSEGVFLDLNSQLAEWNELKDTDTRLKLIDSKKGDWEYLQQARTDYNRLRGRVTDQFKRLVWSLKTQERELQAKLEEAQEHVAIANDAFEDYKPTYKQNAENRRQAISNQGAAEDQVKDLESRLESVEFARAHLGPLCPDGDRGDESILKVLAEQIAVCQADIDGLRDEATAVERMSTLNSTINENKESRDQLNRVLSSYNEDNGLLRELPVYSASVLLSLSNDFAVMNFTPSLEQRTAIEAFTTLFSIDNDNLVFCDTPMEKTKFVERDFEKIKHNLTKEIEVLSDRIQNDQDTLSKLSKDITLSKEGREAKLAEYMVELQTLEKQQTSLKGVGTLQSLIEGARARLEETEALRAQAEETFNAADDTYRSLKLAYNSATDNLSQYRLPLDDIRDNLNELRPIEARSNRLLDLERATRELDPERTVILTAEQVKSEINTLSEELTECLHKRSDCTNSMKKLLEYGVVEASPEDRHELSVSKESFQTYYADLESVFLNLDGERLRYKEQLAHHNNTAAAASRTIENIRAIIDNFIRGINTELEGYKISNLSSVKLDVDLHPQYVDMIKSLSAIGSRTDQLLSETFYEQISNFQTEFYIQNPGKIDIAKIIEKIRYRFERNGVSEDIPQSNGTNCMVNAVLLALLLKRMVPEDLNLTMPVVFDEVGSLDEKNLQEILKVMEEHGLYLFAANPEQNGVIASVLDVYHNLSMFKATDVDVQAKAETIYFPGMEERLEDLENLEDTGKSQFEDNDYAVSTEVEAAAAESDNPNTEIDA